MSGWNNGASATSAETVTVLLAADHGKTATWYQAISIDARFRVAGMANDPQDLQYKLTHNPEVVILDGTLFAGPDDLIQGLTRIQGAVYLFLPPGVGGDILEKIQKVPSVKSVVLGDTPLAELLKRAHGDALALRRQGPALSDPSWRAQRDSAMVAGLRVTTLWNRAGGAGRSTIAASLALAVTRRRLKTLLVGLGAPDILPLHLGLKPHPNIAAWFANPTGEGLRGAIQRAGELDVLAGFADIGAETSISAGMQTKDAKTISDLVWTATYDNYAAVLLDAPVDSLAARALQGSNSLIIVARPTLADAWASVEAFRAVTQMASGQHRINPGNILVALNMRAQGMLSADEWHRSADGAARKAGLQTGFPPVAVTIPYIPEVPLAQEAGRPPLDASDEFARPIHKLADILFGHATGASASTSANNGGRKIISLGPLKIKTGG